MQLEIAQQRRTQLISLERVTKPVVGQDRCQRGIPSAASRSPGPRRNLSLVEAWYSPAGRRISGTTLAVIDGHTMRAHPVRSLGASRGRESRTLDSCVTIRRRRLALLHEAAHINHIIIVH